MEKILGKEMGDFIRSAARGEQACTSSKDNKSKTRRQAWRRSKAAASIEADLVVVGVVKPRLALAEQASPSIAA